MQHDPEVRRICATAYLEHVRSLKARIDMLEEEIAPLRDMATATMDYRERVSGSPNPKRFEDAMVRLEELIAEYCTEMAGFVDEQHEAHVALSRMSRPEYSRALTSHYLLGKTWEMTCVEMGYSWQGMMKLRRRAIDEAYDLMPEEWRRNAIPNAAA